MASISSPASADFYKSANRDRRVDALRGISILLVLLLHFHLSYDLFRSPIGRILPGPYLSNVLWNGNYGVIIFFVISGYLITSTSLRRFQSLGKISLRTFYAFRIARIYPCLLLVLAIVSALSLAGIRSYQNKNGVPLWLADLSVLSFWHNVLMTKFGFFNYNLNVLWSLSVEEVFYLVFPLLCVFLRRARWIVPVWVIAIVLGPIFRHAHPGNEILYLYSYPACFDSIATGCCTALIAHKLRVGAQVRNVVQLIALSEMVWVFLRSNIAEASVWGPTLMALGASIFILAEGSFLQESHAPTAGRPSLSPVQWLGRHSYELYLFHIVLLTGFRIVIGPTAISPIFKLVWLVLFLVVTSAFSWFLSKYYSEPLNRWIRIKLTGRAVV